MDTTTATTYTLDGPTPVLAYSERESCDPTTGEPGILRQEWRAVPFDAGDLRHEALRRSFPSCFPSIVLECRYIRRGTEEPWTPHDAFEHLDGRYTEPSYLNGVYGRHAGGERSFGLLESLLHGHSLRGEIVAVDPRLRRMQEEEREKLRQQEAKKLAEAEAQREREAKAERRRRGGIAFQKLAATKEGEVLCALWDTFVNEATADAIERYKADPEFVRLYKAALEAARVPAKRKALKDLFKYAGV